MLPAGTPDTPKERYKRLALIDQAAAMRRRANLPPLSDEQFNRLTNGQIVRLRVDAERVLYPE